MAADDRATRPAQGDNPEEKIIKEAKRRFKRCEDWESQSRKRFVEDVRFANGDSDNLWQWDGAVRTSRDQNNEPCLTINKIRQHNLNILNDARQNRPAVVVKPTGGGSSYDAAQVFEGIIRRIQYISNAESAYDTAMRFQVEGGIGYIRLATDFSDNGSFDQDIFIRRVRDPLTVYLDPDCREADKSDAKFGFVFDDMDRDEFDAAYPDYKEYATKDPLGNMSETDWLNDKKVRVCEYFRCIEKKDRLIGMVNPERGETEVVRSSKVPKEILDQVIDDPATKIRDIVETKVQRILIVGDKIAEHNEWPGKYIPIVPVIGEELVIDNQMDRWGHTRAAKDPQRIYNYWSSSAVAMVALQGKTPWVATMEAFEGYETYYESANTTNFAWLPYNQYDDKGQKLDPPQRAAPPVFAPAYLQGMQVASEELRAVSGQFESDMGMQGNERSGVAITNRQRQGDLATIHYLDNLRVSIRYVGKQLIDLIPKIYDTGRIIKILAEDGTEQEIRIDPNATEAYMEARKEEESSVKGIFNPNVGNYDVEAQAGPGYATRRQEAFDAFVEIATKSPEIMTVAGDLMFKVADFPMSDELAERLRRMVPPQALGEGPGPEAAQLQQQIQKLTQINAHLLEENASYLVKLRGKDQMRDIDAYKAETDRMKALAPSLPLDPQGLRQMVHNLVAESLQTQRAQVVAASQPDLEVAASSGGGGQAPPSQSEMAVQ